MGWFTKLFGKSDGDTAAMTFPAHVEVVPGELFVDAVSHSIANVPGTFWTFITRGFASHGHAELVVTLLRRATEPEAIPDALRSFFGKLYGRARDGARTYASDCIEFGKPGLLGPDVRGFACVTARPIANVDVPADALHLVMLSSMETTVAVQYGVYRILARLGQQASAYPFPYWSDRDRRSIVDDDTEGDSILAKVARTTARGVSLVAEQQIVKMRVLRPAAETLERTLNELPPGVGFALLTSPAADADAWLVWVRGQNDRAAITAEGSVGARVTGFHLVIAAEVAEDNVLMGEDGFVLMLRAESWQRFRDALRTRGHFDIPASGDALGFELSWVETTYENPVDGRSYEATGGWTTHRPKGGAASTPTPRTSVRLLSSDAAISAAIDVTQLSGYIRAIFAVVETTIPTAGPRRTIYLQFDLARGQLPRVNTTSEPPGESLEGAQRALAELEAPDVRGPVGFQVIVAAGADA